VGAVAVNAFFQELFQLGIYKRTQGRITRQVTLAAMAVAVAVGFWQLSQAMTGTWEWDKNLSLSLATVATLACWWVSYRLVNLPRFADFLIAVEAEMNKVSWPTRGELFRSSVVVLVTIFAMAALLLAFDFIWTWFFTDILGIRS
jgi:preprotein translocase subunit SecE